MVKKKGELPSFSLDYNWLQWGLFIPNTHTRQMRGRRQREIDLDSKWMVGMGGSELIWIEWLRCRRASNVIVTAPNNHLSSLQHVILISTCPASLSKGQNLIWIQICLSSWSCTNFTLRHKSGTQVSSLAAYISSLVLLIKLYKTFIKPYKTL